jgi:hypothetical protein
LSASARDSYSNSGCSSLSQESVMLIGKVLVLLNTTESHFVNKLGHFHSQHTVLQQDIFCHRDRVPLDRIAPSEQRRGTVIESFTFIDQREGTDRPLGWVVFLASEIASDRLELTASCMPFLPEELGQLVKEWFYKLLRSIRDAYGDAFVELADEAGQAIGDEQVGPQVDSGAVVKQLTIAEDEGGKKRGAMARFASEMRQICGDKTIQVFISHATEDTQFAHRLADDLQQLGVQIWIAPESIRPGEGWVEAIERGLAESSHMVVVLTPAALGSEWVRKETDVAIAQERKGLIQVIPLDVEPCEVPLLLGSYQMASFRRNYDAGLSQLVDILGVRLMPSEPACPPRRVPHQQ